MSYQPIKFSKGQYKRLKEIIRKDWGNVSLAKGIYLITFLYLKYVPKSIKETYRRKYYQPFNKKRAGLKYD